MGQTRFPESVLKSRIFPESPETTLMINIALTCMFPESENSVRFSKNSVRIPVRSLSLGTGLSGIRNPGPDTRTADRAVARRLGSPHATTSMDHEMPAERGRGMKPCIDCVAAGRPATRLADKPGPRCATDWRAETKRRSQAAHARRVASVYGLPVGMYEAMYEAQGGRCAICRWATGKTKRLAVDHDHRAECCPPGPTSCGQCVRGLLCGPCNQTIGRMSTESLARALEYLEDPPARYVLDRKVGH